MNVVVAGLSDTGRQREFNEDSLVIVEDCGLYVVADGMGGHQAGNVASKMATEIIADFFRDLGTEESTWPFNYESHLSVEENRILTAIKIANKKIYDTSCVDRKLYGMGTTIVTALLSRDKRRLYFAHVGDSRAYRMRDNKLEQLTRDHSLVNDYLMVMPNLSKEQRDELPKNVITRALGMQESVMADLHAESPQVGDSYLLCSDGLSGMLTDDEIQKALNKHPADVSALVRSLVDDANAHGGDDNITALAIHFSEE